MGNLNQIFFDRNKHSGLIVTAFVTTDHFTFYLSSMSVSQSVCVTVCVYCLDYYAPIVSKFQKNWVRDKVIMKSYSFFFFFIFLSLTFCKWISASWSCINVKIRMRRKHLFVTNSYAVGIKVTAQPCKRLAQSVALIYQTIKEKKLFLSNLIDNSWLIVTLIKAHIDVTWQWSIKVQSQFVSICAYFSAI